jgi:hypothetical protein
VDITPAGVTFRMRLFPESAIKRFPDGSNAIPDGLFNSAAAAGPPSPANPVVRQFPAIVLMYLAPSISRMQAKL